MLLIRALLLHLRTSFLSIPTMRGVGPLTSIALLICILLLIYQHHMQTRTMSECGSDGGEGSREVATPTFARLENVTLASLNTTGKAKVDILFFNRVPKVRTVRTIVFAGD